MTTKRNVSLTAAISEIFVSDKDKKIQQLETENVKLKLEVDRYRAIECLYNMPDLAFQQSRLFNKKLCDHVLETRDLANIVSRGKNDFIRKSAWFELQNKIIKIVSDKELNIENYVIIEDALNNGDDIHRAPLKHHKLELVGDSSIREMGQHIVNQGVAIKEFDDE